MKHMILLCTLMAGYLAALLSGMTYSPYSVSGCLGEEQITSDLQAISQLANRIRLYGCDCNQASLILGTISRNGWGTRVVLGIWTRAGNARFQSDLSATLAVLSDPELKKLVDGVVVGNEDLFNGVPESQLISNIGHVRSELKSAGHQIPISTSEVFNLWTPNLAKHSDVIMSSIYPFYTARASGSNETVAESAANALNQLSKMVNGLEFSKNLVVGETGYPDAGSAPTMFDQASSNNQCDYINSFRCHAAGLPYFFLEAKDGQWKGGYSTEQHFGLLNSDNSLRCPLTPC